FKPTDVPRYQLTYERLSAINPRIVYLEHVPMGRKGPVGNAGGYDVVIQGMSGLAAMNGRARNGVPAVAPPPYIDVGAGFLSAFAVASASRVREVRGQGRRVETSLLMTALVFSLNSVGWFAADAPPRFELFAERIAELRAQGAPFEEQSAAYWQTVS